MRMDKSGSRTRLLILSRQYLLKNVSPRLLKVAGIGVYSSGWFGFEWSGPESNWHLRVLQARVLPLHYRPIIRILPALMG